MEGLVGADGFRVENCEFVANAAYGVYLETELVATISRSWMSENGSDGVRVDFPLSHFWALNQIKEIVGCQGLKTISHCVTNHTRLSRPQNY